MLTSRDTRPADVGHELDRLRADFARLTDTVSSLLRQQSSYAQDGMKTAMSQARTDVASRAADIGRTSQSLAHHARKSVVDVNAQLESRIEHNPVRAVLIAAGIGLVLGLVSRHRS